MSFESTKVIELGSCAFRQWRADHSHCKFIHGYRLISKFWFGCDNLDDRHWVVDFGSLKELKNTLEKQFDHTLCVAADDPCLEDFKKLHEKGVCDLRIMATGVGIERTAQWCFITADMIVRSQTKNRCWVNKVEVWEHEKNSAIYSYESINRCKSEHIEEKKIEPVAVSTHHIMNSEQVLSNGPIPAPVGNKVTSGWSNPFGGTSWGV